MIIYTDANEESETVCIHTLAGHTFSIFTNENNIGINLKTAAGFDVLLDDKNKQLSLKTPKGQKIVADDNNSTVTLDNAAGSKITLSKAETTIDAKVLNINAEVKINGNTTGSGVLKYA